MDRGILKNYQSTVFPQFVFIPKTGYLKKGLNFLFRYFFSDRAINRAINDNYEVVLSPLLPTLEKQLAPKIEAHINLFLSKVPRDELFSST